MTFTEHAAIPSDAALRQEVPTEEPAAVWRPVEQCAVGEYVRRSPTAKRTFVRAGYDRREKRYELRDTEDMNRSIFIRKGTNLVVDFTY